MAVHISYNKICDRCAKPFDVQVIKYADGLPPHTPEPLVLTRKGVEVFRFEELCSSCESVVDGLVDRIQLADDKKKSKHKDESAKTDEPKKEVAAGPQAGTDDDRPF